MMVVHRLYTAMFHVISVTETDMHTQTRWVRTATKVLSKHGEDMRLIGVNLDWQVYWDRLYLKYTDSMGVSLDGNQASESFTAFHRHCREVCSLCCAFLEYLQLSKWQIRAAYPA